MTEVKYPLTIKPLSKEEGGGYQVEYLDLPGCMADGETVEEALKEGEDTRRCNTLSIALLAEGITRRNTLNHLGRH